MNATMKKFGAPESLIKDYDHWVVLLRPGQVTLGALVLVCKDPAARFSKVSRDAFCELQLVTADLEATLARRFQFDKINYLMLMMVDPDVHFHVLPRYRESKCYGDCWFTDHGWPGPPDLSQSNPVDSKTKHVLLDDLRDNWP
ncbi:MAG: HIT family protein [Gammaproteobacteria bacterium]|nr:HIT family protein [Gammaproteobacteria bacterium]